MSCSQSPSQEVGDNAKEIGGFEKSQVDVTDRQIMVDEFGYQIVNIKKGLIALTFPDGTFIRSPTNVIQNIIKSGFKEV